MKIINLEKFNSYFERYLNIYEIKFPNIFVLKIAVIMVNVKENVTNFAKKNMVILIIVIAKQRFIIVIFVLIYVFIMENQEDAIKNAQKNIIIMVLVYVM